ncbi:MAG TPA: DegT/DnrJ/EryC1/StrS family aminotransferase, partial [Ktedonobacteraceae bacterium]|nr:DegT/DnrJ/EryC1/StrS family aminotransferase [Ktedonobacteraceae bacterium]
MERAESHYRYPLAHVNYDVEEIDAVVKTLRAGRTTCGPQVYKFEHTFSQYVGARYSTMVNSGSSADLLVAFGLGEPNLQDEILIPAVTWPTQVWSCLTAGYKVK